MKPEVSWFHLPTQERVNLRGMKAFGLDVTLSRTCTLWQTPQEFSRPGASVGTFLLNRPSWNFCKAANQPTPWDPSGSKRETHAAMLSFPKMNSSRRERYEPVNRPRGPARRLSGLACLRERRCASSRRTFITSSQT